MRTGTILFAASILVAIPCGARAEWPTDPRRLERSIDHAALVEFLDQLRSDARFQVTREARTQEGRELFLVETRGSAGARFRILLFAQQHGDEPAGKDALLVLLRSLALGERRLPADVALYVIPQLNPDGDAAGTRRNAAGVDLNRDHMLLTQPETAALHRIVQRIRPQIAIDCHEFARDSEERGARGWVAWPDITMDGVNNPLFDRAVIDAARRWVDEARAPLAAAGIDFFRYTVGGLPPDEEQRPSAPDVDSALNAIGMYGGMTFIIESAVPRRSAAPQRLDRRVGGYLALFDRLLGDRRWHTRVDRLVTAARQRPLPRFLPTNVMWANPEGRISRFPYRDQETEAPVWVETANLMTDLVVKRAVPTPRGYAIVPAAKEPFAALLTRHQIPFETLATARTFSASRCTLDKVEADWDPLYARYGGRQIVSCAAAAAVELPADTLWVPLDGESAIRAALLLEPLALYGLFQYDAMQGLVGADRTLPIVRVVP